jgi:methionyl-tRNA formyltransferase
MDSRAGRGLLPVSPAIKCAALEMKLPVFQPLNNGELKKILLDLKPDLGVVVAYSRLLKKEILDLLPYGFINAHFSLLPKYRGAAPVRWAVANGEKKTGITIFKIDENMDSGPIIMQKEVSIGENENSIDIFNKLVDIGKIALLDSIKSIAENKANYIPQSGEITFAPKIKMNDTFINFKKDEAYKIHNYVRAFCFEPRARFVSSKEKLIQIISAKYMEKDFDFPPGSICAFEKHKGIFIKCQKGSIFLEKIKPESKNEINSYDYFINGLRLKIGELI